MEKEKKKITEGRMVVLAYYKQKEMERERQKDGEMAESLSAQTGRSSREIKEEE